jgi:hypothetical protein
MVTPDILATLKLPLPLLMLRFQLVDNVYPAFATDDLVIWTNFLDTGTHFHADHAPSLMQ